MSKIKNCFTGVCHTKKDTKRSFGFGWAPFLIFQLFVALLVVQPTAWAGLLSLSVDANGDSVFNGEEEKLQISFETGDDGAAGQTYEYKILANGQTIFTGPGPDIELTNNQTVRVEWDGSVGSGDQRKKLPDGEYTIKVELTQPGGFPVPVPERGELEVNVTLDATAPKITIGIGDNAFSPELGSIPVYYSLSENATRARLEFQRAPGDATLGRPIEVSTESGNHIYNWDGTDSTANRFADGQYTLKLWVKDKGGNEATTAKTETITIDSTAPRVTGIFLSDTIPLVDGMFVNASIPTVSFTAEDGDGTGVDLTGSDTEILIKRADGTDINGTLTYGNRATFSLSNSLDELTENGNYEVSVSIADKVGNVTSRQVKFTFDNAAPTLKSVSTNTGEFVPGSGLKGLTNYVEAALEDNIGLNLDNSSIRLKGPNGSDVLGQQTSPEDNQIRWQLLSPLTAEDGLDDGQYIIEIVGADKAGNRTTPIQIPFLFDNLAPELISIKPTRDGEPFNILGDTVYYNLPLNQFVATFDDGEFGTGVTFSGTDDITGIVFGTPQTDGGIDSISGRAFPDQNNNVLTYILNAPLSRDGSQDGNYSLNVKAADPLGNFKIHSFNLIYDTQVPTLVSTVPAANQTVSNLSDVVVKLNEVTSGIDFVQSAFSLKRGDGENQVEVPIGISSNGTDTATLTLLQPIALDGSDDGTYIIEVTPTDRAGNSGAVVRRQFYLVSQIQPQVRLITPEIGTVNSLDDITVEITNYIGSGINFDASTITVRSVEGVLVPQAKVESDATNNRLTWSTEAAIPRNGTADGRYLITASFVDFSGKRFTQNFSLTLDTQFPSINTVNVGADSLLQLSLDSATTVTDSFSNLTVEFDGTDTDFENTVVSLTGPDGNAIAVHRSNDGGSLLTLNFQNLAILGTYTLTVTPRDNIGNVSETPFIYRFQLDIAVPVVTTVLIGGQSGAVVYVNGSAGEIVATLADTTGIGIAVGEGQSTIVVTSQVGLPVPGITTINSDNQLTWRPVALPDDGSADGQYTVAVTPVDKAGRTGDVVYRAFIFDTQAPRITAATPITLHQPVSYLGGGLMNFQFAVEDVGPALLDLDDQTISLHNNDGESVAGYITHDGNNQLYFTLSAPLPTDGSADGDYTLTVNLVDKAGNPYLVEHNIFYDSQAPQLTSVSLNTETPLNLTPYQVTDVTESINKLTINFEEMSRLDFENTVISLLGPDGSEISLTLQNNGIDEITASFVDLTYSGIYTLSVMPQDIAGNIVQGPVPYPFRVKFDVPVLASVKANTAGASFELTSYQIIDISDSVNSLILEFTDPMRVDFVNTDVTLTGPNGQEISVTQEEGDGSQLMVRFVPIVHSGLYTLTVTPHDIDGNVAQSTMRYQVRLDIALPTVSSVLIDGKLGANIYLNTADTTIVATFADPIGVGLVFGEGASSINVSSAEGLPVSGITTSNGANQLTWTPEALPTDGSADGRYTVTITPVDKTGRSGTVVTRHFILDTQAPRVTSSIPATLHLPVSYLGGSLTLFQFTVEDEGPSSLDLDDQTVEFKKKSGEVVAGQITHDGGNGLFFTLSAPLPTDGSADGEYILAVTLVDQAGNPYHIEHNIFYDSQAPRLSDVSLNTDIPLSLTAYQVTDIAESISKLTLNFVETTRVDFENTMITLVDPNDNVISLTLENNGIDQIMASFVSLTQGGVYTLSVTPQDIAGNVAQGAVLYPFRLKFEAPGLSSVKANTTDTSVELVAYETTDISETVSSLTLAFTDSARVDLENTIVTLTGPNGQEILITLQENEDSQLMVRFVPLAQSGIYTLTVAPQDKAGNVAQQATQYQFRLDTTLPAVSSVLIDGKSGSTVYVRNAIPRIVATITDSIGVGVALGDNGSSIVVTNSQGISVSGTTTSNGSNQLTWIPTPLPIDGTADGLYTVVVTPVDKAGRNGRVVNRQFIYDTQAPRITSVSPLTLHAPISYIGSGLSQFVLSIEDVGPADLVFASQVVALMDADSKPVPAVSTFDELTNQLYLTLTKPFASDGSEDGPYTLNVLLIDKAGNRLTARFEMVYDSKVPEVSSVQVNTPGAPTDLVSTEVADLSESVDTITIQFTEATRIDFENTSVLLTDPDDLPISLTQGNDGVSKMTLSFTELTKIGQYTLFLTPQDIAGNVAQSPKQYAFTLQFILPDVESVIIGDTVTLGSGDIVYVNAENLFIVANLLDPAGVGLSFDSTTGTDIIVATLDGIIVPGRTSTNGTDIIAWSPLTLSSDGSSDGRYAVYVYPVDKKGREGSTIYREFVFDTQEPEITDATPIDLSQPVSYISESLTQLQFTVQDVGPADLTLADQEVRLRNQSGALIPTQLTNDTNNQLYLTLDEPLPLDGSRDGEYTVEIAFTDKSGNVLSIDHPIVYDTQAPTLVSTVPTDGAQLTEDVTQIQVVLDDKGESGIDWSRTTVTLVNPDGVEISGELTSNGKTQMTLTTNQLVADGRYTIQVQAVDRAGNGSQSVFEHYFLLSRPLPAVLSTSPSTVPIEDAYTNEEVERIEVLLETADENHLSTVRLLNAKGQVIAGQQLRQPDKLIYELVRPLATDGSEDGIYTIEFTPISSSGRDGDVQKLTFTYDTQPPELIAKGIQLIVAEPQVNNSLVKLRLDLTDKTAGVDWENLEDDWVTFERLSPNPTEIAGTVSYTIGEASYIIFSLKVPLADDGSNDGKYRVTVTPIDKAGNGDETYEEEFTYDTSPPVIDPNSLLINDTPLLTDIDADTYPSAISTSGGVVVQASVSDTGLGVNLSLSSIVIRNPNGQEITGTTRRNGVDSIIFTSDGLNVEGNYQVTITAVGNDSEQLGFAPNGSITTEFLYETMDPTAVVTNDGGKTEFTDEELTLEGTAADPQGVRRAGPEGDNEIPIPASGVWLVEIVGTGPDGQPIEPVLAEDESGAQEQPWSRWSVDFLPARSGDYDLDIRVTDNAGNFAVYDVGEYTMSVSFSFRGNTFVYPNPVRHSKGDSAFISFDLNTTAEEQVELTLYIYDWGGDLVYSQTYTDITAGERNDTHINWKLKNQAGTPVARGLYVFRLEAVNGAGNRANAVGKILVVD